MTRGGGSFLAGAKSRLLPLWIPFRFFGAAVVFHLLAWLALLVGAQSFPRFLGGLDWPLAALHLITLGVLVMTAIGASLQLLPVATRQALQSTWWPVAIWYLYTPGVAAVALGMGLALPWLLAAGGLAVTLALLAWAALLAINLRGSRGMPVVALHGWAALAALLVMLISALALAGQYLGLSLLDRQTALALHIAFSAYGFMGMLALGFSYILVPMFALSKTPDERQAMASCALAVAALVLAAAAAFGVAPLPLRLAALALAASAVGLHLRLMLVALKTGLRRQLGRSFTLVRLAWACLAASLLLALAVALEVDLAGIASLWVLVLTGGWLLSFLLGMLQRILPFLASMHVAGSGRRPPTPSALSADRPLALHFAAHLGALGGLALAVLTGSSVLALLSAALGVFGAAAFAAFFLSLLRRLRTESSAPALPKTSAP